MRIEEVIKEKVLLRHLDGWKLTTFAECPHRFYIGACLVILNLE